MVRTRSEPSTGIAQLDRHNQEHVLSIAGSSKRTTPPKVIELRSCGTSILRSADKMVVANQLDIVAIEKMKKVVEVDVSIPSDRNIRQKEHGKLKIHQGLKEELGRMWGVKTSVVPVVKGAHRAATPKLRVAPTNPRNHLRSLTKRGQS